jgi:Flp pilus assembly protein TadB
VTLVVALSCGAAVALMVLGASQQLGPVRRLLPVGSDPHPPAADRSGAAGRVTASSRASPSVDDCINTVEQVARELRSGSSAGAALAAALSAHPTVLVDVRRHLDQGATVRLVADRVRASTAHERLVLQAVRVGQRAGGSGAGVFERAAEVLREHQAWAHERRSLTAQARLSARVLTALPIVFACWSIAADDSVRQAYLTSPLPALSATAGAALNLVGWWWMRRLVRVGP